MIDLHIHSTCSDGTFTPAEIIAAAESAGLSAVALTDHDTLAGANDFLKAARGRRVRALIGVEIAARHSPGEMHVLGYGLERAPDSFREWLVRQQAERRARNMRILARLAKLGMPVSEEEIAVGSKGEVMGRPHIADALVRKGYARDKAEAFERWLGKEQPAYEERRHPEPEECLEQIRAAGGVAVLAHPISLELARTELLRLVSRLRAAGLRGLEVWHPEHSVTFRRELLRLAQDHGLVATGGSDFHGARSPHLRLGVGFGDLCVPDDVLPRLLGE